MEKLTQEELKAHLMETDEEYRRLATQHSQYKSQLKTLEASPPLSEQEQVEEVRLKKLKLHIKDQMTAILDRNRAQQCR